jgi:pimeloyl-ACP methyl ester carboxylesterase
MLLTADGVPLAAHHDEARDGRRDLCLVVAHGFTGWSQRPAVRAVVATLSAYAGVVTFDFRGHGRSGGRTTVGDLEAYDVAAAAGWARVLGYRRVVTVGFSLGGAVVLRHGGLQGQTPGMPAGVDAVVSVSTVSHWYYRGTAAMRRLHRACELRAGRALLRVRFRTHVDPRHWARDRPESWAPDPSALAARISPVPVLLVHGDRDEWIPLTHARALYAAAAEPKELWIEPGFGHAESAASPELLGRIARWAVAATAGRGGVESAAGRASEWPGRRCATGRRPARPPAWRRRRRRPPRWVKPSPGPRSVTVPGWPRCSRAARSSSTGGRPAATTGSPTATWSTCCRPSPAADPASPDPTRCVGASDRALE